MEACEYANRQYSGAAIRHHLPIRIRSAFVTSDAIGDRGLRKVCRVLSSGLPESGRIAFLASSL